MPKSDFKGKIILVVDDEQSYREVLAKMLTTRGFKTLEASNGEEGLEICEVMNVDYVITDVFMRILDGIDMGRAIKLKYPDIKVFYTSAVYPPKKLESLIPKNKFIEKNPNLEIFVDTFIQLLQFHQNSSLQSSGERPENHTN